MSSFVWRRQAARVVLLDRQDRVLLIRASDPANRTKGHWWEIPGGGMEGGEPSANAARRELYEETGLSDIEMGPCVWRQHVTFEFAGIRFDQDEWVHVARCDGGEYCPAGLEQLEAAAFDGARWWALSELPVLDGSEGNRVLPPWLPAQLPTVLEGLASVGAWPAEPIDLGHVGPA